MHRVSRTAALALAAVLAFAGSAAAQTAVDVDTSTLRGAVTVDGIIEHQQALQDIADANGGTRHTETPGYLASVDYVMRTMRAAGLNTRRTSFNMPEWEETQPPVFQQVSPTPTTYTPGTAADDDSPAVDYITFEFSPTASVTAPVVPTTDIQIDPNPGGSTSGCEDEDYPAAVSGAIALIQRGTCPFVQKLALAQQNGAVGVILFNEGDTAGRVNALFRSGPTDLAIPSVLSSYAVGAELYAAYQSGQNPTVHLETYGANVDHFYPQVIAETRTGSPTHTVVVGAHLDSVTSGPGINDDGSGTAWQLELAEEIQELGLSPQNRIRFMWFGGEEDGLVGSQYYAASLSQDQVDKIDVMIDTDMIASPNYVRFVYDGDGSTFPTDGPDGSAVVEDVFLDYFSGQGMATLPQAFDGRSDYVGFINRGIPAGGIFAGAEVPKTAAQAAVFGGVAGEQYDPCYHEACDTIDTVTGQPPADTMNVFDTDPELAQQQADSLNGNALKSLREMSGAVTHAAWYFANTRDVLPSRTTALASTARFKFEGHGRVARTH